MQQIKLITILFLLTLLVFCSENTKVHDNLYRLNHNELSKLVRTDPEAKDIFNTIHSLAEEALLGSASPLDTIHYEGLIDTDPRRLYSKECLQDAKKSEFLAWTYLITSDGKYLNKAKDIIFAWSEKYIPSGNPISEKELIPMIRAFGLLQSEFSAGEKRTVERWLSVLAKAEISEEDKNSSIFINNWQAKRLWIVGYVGFMLENQDFINYAVDGYKVYVDSAFYEDGKSFDFIHRDALHYHASGLWPLIDLAIVADRHGIDLAGYENPAGGSLQKCIEFMIPYSNGEKQHREFVNSTVKFDRIRASAGEEEYSEKIFDGKRAALVFEYYSYFDDSHLPLAFKINGSNARRFSSWRTVVNYILKTSAPLAG